MILHLGRDSKNKRRRIYEQILSAPEATIITPEQATLDLERDLIETLGLPGLLFHEVTSFSRILSRMMEHYDWDHLISDMGKYLLLRQSVEELKEELPLYGKSFDKEGFYEELSSTIELFERAGIRPEALREGADGDRIRELAHIYAAYTKKIENQRFYEGAALDLFEQSHLPGLYSKDEVWILGYKALDDRQWRMIETMNPHTTLHVVLSWEEEDIFIPTHRMKEALERRFSCKVVLEKERPDEKVLFCKELLREEGKKRNLVPEVFSAKDPYTEAEFVGLHILKALKEDSSLRYADFKILVSDMESYDFVFRQVFTELGLPLFSDRRRSVLESPMIRTFLSLLRIYERGFRREEVLGFLKGYLPESQWEALDLFENYCFSRGIGGKKFKEPFADEAMEALRGEFLAPLLVFEESFKEKGTPEHFENRLQRLLEALFFSQRLEEEARSYAERGEGEQAQLLAQLWESLQDLLTQLSSIGAGEVLSFSEYLRRLEVGLSKMSLGVIPPAVDQIRLATLFRSSHDPVRFLYFCGMNDGLLPREYAEDLLLKEEDKRRLQEAGFLLHDNFEHKEQLDRLDFFTALSLVEKGYFFSYVLADLQGKSKTPSLFVERIIQRTEPIFYASAHSDRYLQNYYGLHSGMSFRYGLRALRENRQEAIRGLSEEKLEKMKVLLSGAPPLKPLKREEKRLHASISRLERFRRCPFQYFITDDLRAKKRRAYAIDRMDLGNFFHEVLERTLSDFSQGCFERHELGDYLNRLSEELLEKEEYGAFKAEGAGAYLLRRSLVSLEALADFLIRHGEKSQFKPHYFEQKFSIEEDRFVFRGIIDRVDTLGDHFVAVDYKTGGKTFDLNRVFQGIDLQLMLYIDGFRSENPQFHPAGVFYFRLYDPIVEEDRSWESALKFDGLFIGDPDLARAYDPEGSLLPLRLTKEGQYYKGSLALEPHQAQNLLQRARDFSRAYVEQIQGGDMAILPLYDARGGPGFTLACETCDYGAICQYDPRSPGARVRTLDFLSNEKILEELE